MAAMMVATHLPKTRLASYPRHHLPHLTRPATPHLSPDPALFTEGVPAGQVGPGSAVGQALGSGLLARSHSILRTTV